MRGANLKLKKAGGGLGGRAQRLPPDASQLVGCWLLVVCCCILGLRIACWWLLLLLLLLLGSPYCSWTECGHERRQP